MSGIIGHTLYAELAFRELLRRKWPLAGKLQRHRSSFHAGAYLGSDIQVMPEAICVESGREVGFGTVPLTRSPITGGPVKQFKLTTPTGLLSATQVHQHFYGRSHLLFGWTAADQSLRVPWDHLPDYCAAVLDDLELNQERALAYTLGWVVHVVSDSLIKGQHAGLELHLLDGRYTVKNRPIQDLVSFHDVGIAELGLDWTRVMADLAATPVEEIQLHYMRCAPPRGNLAKLFPDGWQPAAESTLRAVLTENRRYVKHHADDELASLRLIDGECTPQLRERSGLTLAEMRAEAKRAGFRDMLDRMTEQILVVFEALRQRCPKLNEAT